MRHSTDVLVVKQDHALWGNNRRMSALVSVSVASGFASRMFLALPLKTPKLLSDVSSNLDVTWMFYMCDMFFFFLCFPLWRETWHFYNCHEQSTVLIIGLPVRKAQAPPSFLDGIRTVEDLLSENQHFRALFFFTLERSLSRYFFHDV